MKKNSIGKTLRRLAVLTALICIALVGWSTAENDGQIVYADEVQVVSSAQGISNKEAAEGFIRMQMRTSIPEDSLSKATGSAGRRKLTSTYDQHFYDGLRTQVLKVVNGEVSSTVFTIPYVDIYGSDKICFTPNELVPGTTTVNQAVKDAFNERVGINLDKIIDALLVDCPYELFWYDKSCGISNSSYAIRTYSNGTQEIYLPGEAYTVSMRVAKEYAVSGETHVFNTQYYGQVSAAVARAEAILDRYSGQSDIGKLNAYKNEICALTDYNRAAADEGAPYGNPWQMIWVFDGDPETKVVCEGYSKAFQYLCDNSSLSSVSTLLVTGQMGEAGKSSGGHMWNIVRLADGKNYMADVTNSDSGSIGQNGGLFLAGYSSVQNQSGNRIYVYEVDQNNIAYYYFDNDSIGLYGTDALALAPRNEMYSGNYNTTVSWTLHSDGLLRIFGYGSMEDKNSMPWSEYSEEIFAVEITSGVTRIPASAFKDCLYLADVSIPSTVTQIGDYAFKGCSALTSMALPANMTVFGQGVFSQSGLTSIPDHLNTTIPPAGFQSCNGLANITVPTGVATISGSAFKDCSNLQTISLPASVTSIESEAFRECVNLREITIPNSVTSIESNAFLNCSELEGVYFLGTESEWETLRNAAIQAGGNNALANATVHCLPGGQCGENCFWKLEDDGTLYITGTGAMYNYDIIGTTGLQSPFYAHKDRICSIVMGEGVTQIGNWAFYQLDQVSAVSLPGSLTIIGRQAFAECEGITEIVIPDHVTSIGNQAFFECTSLETVDLPASLTRLEGSFEGCSQLKNITIPANTTTIYGSAFKGCKNLESMILPEGLTTLELGIFQNCTGLKSVTLPTTVTTIQKGAFAACSALTDVYYGGTNATRQSITVQADNDLLEHPTVTWHYANGNGGSCGEKAWWHLYDNQRLVITGTGSIYDYKAEDFYRAPWYSVRSNIQSIEVEEGITNIGTYAFADCENVTGVSLPEDLLIIKEAAFSGCRRMNPVIIPDTVTSIGDQAFQDCYALTTMIIPESVYTIGDYAFADCNNLQTVSVPGTIARIGTNAFSSCEALTSVYFCGTEAQWRNLRCTSVTESMVKYHSLQKNERQPATSTANGFEEHWECIYCHKLYLDAEGTNRTTVADLTILATGQKCGESLFWAFDEATYILTISGTGEMYDYNDQSLAPWAGIREQITTVVIESGATTIGEFAFSGCGAITGITMPTTLTVIGDYAFENCSKLTAVVIPSGMTTLGEGAFTGCSTLNSVTLPNSVTGIGIHAFSECPALTQIQIPASVESIGGYAFALSGLKAITIPSGVTSIGEYAFSRCGDLESAVINANITGIPEGLFNQCDELTSVTIPNTVTSIGDSAFEETSLTDITTLLTYVTSIGSDAFRSCQQLESVVIPSGVQTIGKNAFNSCSNLESVSIPGTVTSMGGKDPLNQNDKNHVFDQCIKLTEICFCGTEAQWTALNTALPNQTTQLRYHNYGTASYTWAEDNSTVTASHTCEYCSAVETEEAITTSEETTPATCEDTGVRTYTAAFENTAFTTQTKTVTIAALDHAYGDAIYTWADENGTCTATRTCTRDNCSGTETETVNATSEVTKAATCTAKGETTYTATFTNTAFETQTKTAEISALGHTPGTAVQENRVESTCTAAGSYDEVIKCVTCGHVISSEKKMLPLAAHTPEHHPAVSHSCYVDGNKEYWQCTACGKYFQEEQATNEITQAQTVDPARHTLEYRAAQASSCTWQGNVEHWICTVCKTCFSDQAGTQIIADVKLPALNHPDTEIRTGARTEPTCIASGGYYQYIYCNTCQNIIDSTWIDLDPLGHDFGDPVYVWSADHSTCTATRTCTRDNCTGKETQEGTVSSKQTKEPTCTEKGETTYTAVFENTAFETQTETVSNIDARGHDLIHHDAKAPTCTEVGWDAYDTCSRCDYTTYAEKDALGHDLKPVAEVPATCTTDGTEAYWKCDRCDLLFSDAEGKNRIDEPVVISAAHVLVHHDAQAPTCTEIGWDAYDTCSRCDYTTYVEKAALGHDYVDHAAQAPTCTEIGWDAYKTCSRCDYTSYVQKPALGHDYETVVTHGKRESEATLVKEKRRPGAIQLRTSVPRIARPTRLSSKLRPPESFCAIDERPPFTHGPQGTASLLLRPVQATQLRPMAGSNLTESTHIQPKSQGKNDKIFMNGGTNGRTLRLMPRKEVQ